MGYLWLSCRLSVRIQWNNYVNYLVQCLTAIGNSLKCQIPLPSSSSSPSSSPFPSFCPILQISVGLGIVREIILCRALLQKLNALVGVPSFSPSLLLVATMHAYPAPCLPCCNSGRESSCSQNRRASHRAASSVQRWCTGWWTTWRVSRHRRWRLISCRWDSTGRAHGTVCSGPPGNQSWSLKQLSFPVMGSMSCGKALLLVNIRPICSQWTCRSWFERHYTLT